MTLTRFERKLLLVLVAVAVMPMLGALFFGRAALQEAYQVGVNERVQQQLEGGLSLYRRHFASLRRQADELALAAVADHGLQTALSQPPSGFISEPVVAAVLNRILQRHPNLGELKLVSKNDTVIAHAVRGGATAKAGQAPVGRPLVIHKSFSVSQRGYVLTLSLPPPPGLFEAYQDAGEMTRVYGQLKDNSALVSRYYLLVYMAFLLAVIIVTVTVGAALSRRVTRRVAELAEATGRVGAGDLSVQVPTSGEDEIGELTRAFNAMVRDIHDSRDRIEYLQRLGAWQEFARRLAHEIKNPLTPIQLAIQEVHRSYGGDDARFQGRLDDALSIVQEEVATLRRLVGEFSDFARLPEAMLEPADLGQFLSASVLAFGAVADSVQGKDGKPVGVVRCDPTDKPLPTRLDSMMLRRCIDNLIRNALQAIRDSAPAGTEQPGTEQPGEVTISVGKEGTRAFIAVADNGPGIDPSLRNRIFDPYVTTKSDGTGLGLSIVKKIVFEHQGEIRCEDNQRGGTRFTILLSMNGE